MRPIVSVLGAELTISGSIETAGDVHVLGRVEGPIKARGLAIAEGAQVDGNLIAEIVDIDGVVTGTIDADLVRVGAHGRVRGQIRYGSLTSARGADVDARCLPRKQAELPGPALVGVVPRGAL